MRQDVITQVIDRHIPPQSLEEQWDIERASLRRLGKSIRGRRASFCEGMVEGIDRRLARQALGQGLSLEQMSLAMMEEALREHRGNLSAAVAAAP